MSTTPRSLAAAREAGAVRYYTGAPCLRGHVAERLTSTQGCVECYTLARRARAAAARTRDEEPDEVPPPEVADILAAMAASRMVSMDSLAERVAMPVAHVEALLAPHRDRHWRIAAHIVSASGSARLVVQVGPGPSAARAPAHVRGVSSIFGMTLPNPAYQFADNCAL